MRKELLFSSCLLMGFITGVKAKDIPLPQTLTAPFNLQVPSQDEEAGTKIITVKAPGEFATFANSSSLTDEYTSATRINVVGNNVMLNTEDLAAVEKFTAIKILDLSKVKVENVDAYKNIKTPTINYQASKINLIIPCAEDTTNADGSISYTDQSAYLKGVGEKVAASWDSNLQTISDFYINEAGNRTCHSFIKSSNGWNIDDVVKGADNLDIVSNDGNLCNSFSNFLISLNNVNVTRLVLANLFNYGQEFDFTSFTNPYVHCIVLPNQAGNDMTQPIKLGDGAIAKVFQALKSERIWMDGASKTKDIYYVYCTEPGALAKIENNHYYQSDISNAWSERFYGNVNEADFKYLTKVKNNRFNMANLKHEDADGNIIDLSHAIATINNPYIEYLALPDGVREANDPTFKNLFEGADACTNLKAVGFISKVKNGEGEEATTKNTITIASNERGGIYELLDMLGSSRTNIANKYQLSGLAYAKDLAVGSIYVDKNGHRSVKVKDATDGTYEGDNNGTLITGLINVSNATEFDYSNIRLWNEGEEISDEEKAAAQNDLLFTAMGYNSKMTILKLPRDKSVYRLPNSCLANFSNIKTLCVPRNYTEIGSTAFLNDPSLQLIYTTAVNSNGEEGYLVGGKFQQEEPTADNTKEHTCQLPTNLTRIEKHAFANCEMFTDVYASTNDKGEVPYCEKDAFSSGSLQGWGGFQGTHPITRENYKNSTDDKKMFAVLHFPSGLTKAKAELFTDLNRDYSLADEKGTTDGNGDVLIWPTHVEWNRSFHQANAGYTWFDWNLYDETGSLYGGTGENIEKRESLLDKDGNLSTTATSYGLKAISGDKATYNTFAPRNPNYTEGSKESILEEHNTWIGWHQFVLTDAFDYINPTENKWHAYTTDDNWWTTCLPFNMSKKEIIDTWGEGTKLCTLVGVKRDATNNTITLEFGEDLVAKAQNDDDKVLYFRRPYMIKPGQMEKLKDENGDYTGPVFKLTDEQNQTLETAAELVQSEVGKHPRPADSEEGDQCCVSVTAKDEKGQEIKGYDYTFLGSYTKYYVPTYAYFLGWDVNKVNYFYQTEKPIIMNWNPYTCMIGHFSPNEATWSTYIGVSNRWAFASDDTDTEQRTVNEDLMPGTTQTPVGAKGMKLYFGADNTTSIDQISSEGGIKTIPMADVYNLSGQLVRKKGMLEGLSKGIYIIGGKKYIVK